MSFYDLSYTRLEGGEEPLAQHRGKVVLVVNVASRCGYTDQYAELQALHAQFGPRGLVVIGFPCDQFANQEPGDGAQIQAFCSARFGVTFALSEKVDVNGRRRHPVFAFLCGALPGLLGTRRVKWNFTKFLVGRDGRARRRFSPRARPLTLLPAITAALDESPPLGATAVQGA